MLLTKSFVKKTKKGGVVKVVREHYLRDDIWCGCLCCDACQATEKCLESEPERVESHLLSGGYYLLPDTNVVLHQIDFLEDDSIHNVIITQTVVEEVRHRNAAAYKRLRDLIGKPDKHFYVFSNEHHRETYVERKPDESSNDRNDRAIREAAKWYMQHLQKSQKPDTYILLLTNDKDNRDLARTDGLEAYAVREYVKSLTSSAMLLDRLAGLDESMEEDMQPGKKREMFEEHQSLSKLQTGIKSGKFLQGTFHISRDNYKEGNVIVSGMEKSVLICGLLHLNRAVDGDSVAVQLLAEDEWKRPSVVFQDVANVERSGDDDDDDDGDDDNDGGKESSAMETKATTPVASDTQMEIRPTGKVIGIVKRNWRPYCGILRASSNTGSYNHLFIPAERKIPYISLQTRQAELLSSQRIIVSIDNWPRHSRYPRGHFVRALGKIGDKDTENEVLLLEHDVPHQPFSAAVTACLPSLPWLITNEDEQKRQNLRHLAICSVDPPGCTDIDDALHCIKLENGNFEVGVHIADVSHFIRPGTAVDNEAADRCTTVYLTDKRIDMVPELLSSNLCSLRSNVDRFAFSCMWELSPDASIVNTRFAKSIIRSRASFTYAEAQLRIDNASETDELAVSLRYLNSLAKILKKGRISSGALTLASPEVNFSLDNETHDPISVKTKQSLETNSMVEEFMLLANISVARHIHDHFPQVAVLRRHPSPPTSNYEPLVKAALSKGITLAVDTNKALADSLESAVIPDQPFFNTMLRILATRCMMQALYFCSGSLARDEYHHYGLAADIYTHFTSPIRRYSDLMVHRLLAVSIGADNTFADLLDKHKVEKVCNQLNYRHRMAQYAGRASVGLHTQLFFKNRVTEEEGYVLAVRKNALQILIPKYGLEAPLRLDSSIFTYSANVPSADAGDVSFTIFDSLIVRVSLDDDDLQHQRLKLALISPKVKGFSVSSQSELRQSIEPAAKRVLK
ncbi:exosome complex exonuclease RRP44-like [Sycon ciliatum]|uniref:exosome complex exonuclease RRP44-like n=1 Tax=Sycon ciliatum TaxID=27933 RepID=UPI0031F6CE7F|eukprot:scpid26190/ scgid5635/ Exosome complex exonuclease RRP44; Protein DIS3 homolog; Ribosomal RNA-processing protein 44